MRVLSSLVPTVGTLEYMSTFEFLSCTLEGLTLYGVSTASQIVHSLQ